MRATREKTYLIETYAPGLDRRTAAGMTVHLVEAVSTLRAEGLAIEWRGSLSLPAEETYLYLISARRAADVARVSATARVTYDRLSEVVATWPRATAANRSRAR